MIDAFIAYLQASTSSFVSIIHAQDQRPVDDQQAELPLLGIFPDEDQVSDDATEFLTAHMVTSVLQVHIACPIEQLESLRAELRGAALGWSAGPEYTSLALMGGRMLKLQAGVAWWEERYANRVHIRSAY